jgi:hypothetical protein
MTTRLTFSLATLEQDEAMLLAGWSQRLRCLFRSTFLAVFPRLRPAIQSALRNGGGCDQELKSPSRPVRHLQPDAMRYLDSSWLQSLRLVKCPARMQHGGCER